MKERFIALLKNNGGVSNKDAQSEFSKPEEKTLLVEVINELSKQVLSGKFAAGGTIYISANLKGLVFQSEIVPWMTLLGCLGLWRGARTREDPFFRCLLGAPFDLLGAL